jgi:hypothetical protein
MDQADLSAAARLHVNAVRYWEKRSEIPTVRREPYAVRRMRLALASRGVETFTEPSPGVRLASGEPHDVGHPSPEREIMRDGFYI